MSGIYFHIPFCKVQCNYCDFFKTTNLSFIKSYIQAVKAEMMIRREYLTEKNIDTIYFGGGTPSILSSSEIEELLAAVYSTFSVESKAEISLEANPDDLSLEFLKSIKDIGINRLSIGIQSFSDTDLMLMGRRHNSSQAIEAVKTAQNVGINNISVDLIYGIPGMSFQQWQTNLNTVFELGVQHLSAYHLTYHENTIFWGKLQKGLIHEVDEEESLQQLDELIKCAEVNCFYQYEISNFAREGYYSKHNSSYWNQIEYLGLGPSAHSYNRKTRYWNVSNIGQYLISVEGGNIGGGEEILTVNDRFNDYIITRLRTSWGINIDYILKEFGQEFLSHVEKMTMKYSPLGKVTNDNDYIKITKAGIFISDQIISDYLYINKMRK